MHIIYNVCIYDAFWNSTVGNTIAKKPGFKSTFNELH